MLKNFDVFAAKIQVTFVNQKLLTFFFQKEYQCIFLFQDRTF